MSDDVSFSLIESPYQREVKKIKNDRSEFEICEINERVVSRVPLFKKYMYIHLKEDDDGGTYWDVLIIKGDEPTHFTIGKEGSVSK